ncbi:transglycosylase SLT domain-containing protein [Arenicella sp. 4NH20-0111]|uniref:transglycosylase SLT domain-containing protein n=1 Tax=Arenicella sp. 4NH20-0111 TaxID=3127648 RepID=UPI003340C28C
MNICNRYSLLMGFIQIIKKLVKLLTIFLRFSVKNIELVLISGLIVFTAIQYYLRPQNQSLDQVVANGTLRVLIADEPDSLYVFNRENYGFEYELLARYADMLGVELKLDVVPYAELFTLLEGGFGDLAVGGIIDSKYVRRVTQPTIAWYKAKATILYKRGTKAPRTLSDFENVKILASSRYYQIDQFTDLEIEDDYRSEYQLLSAVDQGTARFVLSTDYRAKNAKYYLPNLNRSFILPEKLDVVWALPKRHDRKLLDSLNAFLGNASSDGTTARLAKRHFGVPPRLSIYDTLALHRRIETILPSFEYKFRTAARRGNLDWQLLAALAYQESHWSNEARSPTGVRGIMQMTTQTAQFLGVEDRLNMDESIDAAAIYLKRLKKRLPKLIEEPERTWFAVGAYNIGYKHILAAYKKARDQGLDRSKWNTISKLLPTLYGTPFDKGVQAKNYVDRIQKFTDIIRFYDLHQRSEAELHRSLTLLEPRDTL